MLGLEVAYEEFGIQPEATIWHVSLNSKYSFVPHTTEIILSVSFLVRKCTPKSLSLPLTFPKVAKFETSRFQSLWLKLLHEAKSSSCKSALQESGITFLHFSISTINVLNLGYKASTARYILLEFCYFYLVKGLELKLLSIVRSECLDV